MKYINNKRDGIIYSCFLILMGALLLIHYICIRPIMICDPDDWTYISYIRQAVPLWGAWNPAKIFPETIEGLLGDFAAFVIYPIVGKYGYAMSYVSVSFLLSVF